ncbi:MAG: Guanidinobutyrase [Firmicutes bacterium ADurb.Bin419]|nr:MAG: Guanidinobutyrase [Firmicutes bacterium ADurb.Bin419]
MDSERSNISDLYNSTPRFCGLPTFMRLPEYKDIDKSDVVIVGIPFDDTSSYRTGSRFAPRFIRNVSTCLKKYNRFFDVDIFGSGIISDYGDIPVIPGYIEKSYNLITDELSKIVDKGAVTIAIGGDHGILLPELRAFKEKYGKLSVISFDAHRDCSNLHFGQPYGHGTTFRRAIEEELIDPHSSIIIGVRGSGYSSRDYILPKELGFELIDMESFYASNIADIGNTISKVIGQKPCFVTFDMDCIDPAYAPGVNTPEICGFTSRECLFLIRQLEGLSIVGCDLVEMNPQYDYGEITAYLAGNIIFELLSIILKNK